MSLPWKTRISGWRLLPDTPDLCPTTPSFRLHHATLGGSLLELIALLLEAQGHRDIKDSNGENLGTPTPDPGGQHAPATSQQCQGCGRGFRACRCWTSSVFTAYWGRGWY